MKKCFKILDTESTDKYITNACMLNWLSKVKTSYSSNSTMVRLVDKQIEVFTNFDKHSSKGGPKIHTIDTKEDKELYNVNDLLCWMLWIKKVNGHTQDIDDCKNVGWCIEQQIDLFMDELK
jgi:hypothetical protein